MEQRITYDLIKLMKPCYDPTEIGMPIDYDDAICNFIAEYRDKVKNKVDIMWVLLSHRFLTDKELRLYAVWCARQVQHLIKDKRSINALDIAESYANGNATQEDLKGAYAAAYAVVAATVTAAYAYAAAYAAAYANATVAATAAATAAHAVAATAAHAVAAATADAINLQIDRLLEIFKKKELNNAI